jgi:hypothetical protein
MGRSMAGDDEDRPAHVWIAEELRSSVDARMMLVPALRRLSDRDCQTPDVFLSPGSDVRSRDVAQQPPVVLAWNRDERVLLLRCCSAPR